MPSTVRPDRASPTTPTRPSPRGGRKNGCFEQCGKRSGSAQGNTETPLRGGGGCRRGFAAGGVGGGLWDLGFAMQKLNLRFRRRPRSAPQPSPRGEFSFGAIKSKASTVAKKQKPQTPGYKQQALSVTTHHEPRAAPASPFGGDGGAAASGGLFGRMRITGARGGKVKKYDRTFRPCNANYPHPNPPPEEGEKEGRIMPKQLGCGRGRPPPYGRGRRARGSAAVGSGK